MERFCRGHCSFDRPSSASFRIFFFDKQTCPSFQDKGRGQTARRNCRHVFPEHVKVLRGMYDITYMSSFINTRRGRRWRPLLLWLPLSFRTLFASCQRFSSLARLRSWQWRGPVVGFLVYSSRRCEEGVSLPGFCVASRWKLLPLWLFAFARMDPRRLLLESIIFYARRSSERKGTCGFSPIIDVLLVCQVVVVVVAILVPAACITLPWSRGR